MSLKSFIKRKIKGTQSRFGADASAVVRYRGGVFLANTRNKLEARLLTGHYDDHIFGFLENVIRPGDTCFDVGSNIGIYAAVFANMVGPTGAVHAFEPVDHVRRKNRFNLTLSGASNVTLNAIALGEREGTADMMQVKEGHIRAGTSSMLATENMDSMGRDAFETKPVQLMTLDAYVRERSVERIRFIKVDIEGYELNFLRGAQQTLAAHKPMMIMEFAQLRLKHLGIAETDIRDALVPHGYQAFEFGSEDGHLYLTPFNFDRKIRGRDIVAIAAD